MNMRHSPLAFATPATAAAALLLLIVSPPAPAQERLYPRVDAGVDTSLNDVRAADDYRDDTESAGLRYGLDREEDFASDDFDVSLSEDDYDPIGFNEDRYFNSDNNWTTDDPGWNDWYDNNIGWAETGDEDELGHEDELGLEDDEFGVEDDFSENDDFGLDHNFGIGDD